MINGRTVRGNERSYHHYAAQLNSIPLFDHAVRDPSDAFLWRLAGCGGNGFLTNIRPEDGTASMGWHGDSDMLSRDAYSADFGPGFYGHWCACGRWLRRLAPAVSLSADLAHGCFRSPLAGRTLGATYFAARTSDGCASPATSRPSLQRREAAAVERRPRFA